MGKNTKIQWTDDTVNPTLGCDGCELWNRRQGNMRCYAGALTERRGEINPGLAMNFDVVEEGPSGRVAAAAACPSLRGKNRPGKPWLDGLPRLIFVGDMSDNFSKGIRFEFLRDEVVEPVRSQTGTRHQWQWLTKRPARMAKFSRWLGVQGIEWPPNLWVGTSVTSGSTTSRIHDLLKVGDDRTIRFVSVEPQFEEIDLGEYLPQLNWVIQGGESGSKENVFEIRWALSMRDACAEAGVPYFLKQLGTACRDCGGKLRFDAAHDHGDWSIWPRGLRVRQMPLALGSAPQSSPRQRCVELPA